MNSVQRTTLQRHTISPVFDSHSRVLILGSFPSVKSRETGFFYGHLQNRFWRVLAALTKSPLPTTVEQKRQLLLQNGIAVWDVIQSCEIIGSSDSSIKNVAVNDVAWLLAQTGIDRIYTNGKTAHGLFCKYLQKPLGQTAIALPSTSPANAAWSIEQLIEAWRVIL